MLINLDLFVKEDLILLVNNIAVEITRTFTIDHLGLYITLLTILLLLLYSKKHNTSYTSTNHGTDVQQKQNVPSFSNKNVDSRLLIDRAIYKFTHTEEYVLLGGNAILSSKNNEVYLYKNSWSDQDKTSEICPLHEQILSISCILLESLCIVATICILFDPGQNLSPAIGMLLIETILLALTCMLFEFTGQDLICKENIEYNMMEIMEVSPKAEAIENETIELGVEATEDMYQHNPTPAPMLEDLIDDIRVEEGPLEMLVQITVENVFKAQEYSVSGGPSASSL